MSYQPAIAQMAHLSQQPRLAPSRTKLHSILGTQHPVHLTKSLQYYLTTPPVRRNNGHRHHRHPPPHTLRSLSQPSPFPPNTQHRLLPTQHFTFHCHTYDIRIKIYALPSNMDTHAPTSSAVVVSRHAAYGLCYDCEYVCCNLRSGMGWVDAVYCVGDVVVGCRC
jgi:hypothetical protein